MGGRVGLMGPLVAAVLVVMAPAFTLAQTLALAPFIVAFLAFIAFARSLRKRFPARVNCWFCNSNMWVPYNWRNSWNCKKCDQYNGFRQDGDYNVVLDTRTVNTINYNRNLKPTMESGNGLCHKCNINQQLKIRQLSGFIPMNEKNFNSEINEFKSHLEKVYSLCSSCKKYVKHKLLSERGSLLGNKILHARMNKEIGKKIQAISIIKDILKDTLKLVIILFLVFNLYNVFVNAEVFLSKKVLYQTKKYFNTIYMDVKNVTFPIVNNFSDDVAKFIQKYPFISVLTAQYSLFRNKLETYTNHSSIVELNDAVLGVNVMETLTIVGFVLQTLLHLFNFKFTVRLITDDIVWILAVYTSKSELKYLYFLQVLFATILLINNGDKSIKSKNRKNIKRKIKNLSNNTTREDEDGYLISDESDSESCCSFNSSSEEFVNNVGLKSSPNSVYGSNYRNSNISPFSNRSQFKYEKSKAAFESRQFNSLDTSRNELDLNKSISSLSIGRKDSNSVQHNSPFVPRQYKCTSPSIFTVSSAKFAKPILSPSRLTQGTQQSWVAGGYWGADSSQLSCNLHETGSSSSQSSGFESLTSSMYRRNANSFPPSREESVCSDYEKRNENYRTPGAQSSSRSFNSFMPHKPPVFPVMKPNETIFMPSVPFDSSYGNSYNSAFVRPNPNKSFVPLNGSFTNATHRSPT